MMNKRLYRTQIGIQCDLMPKISLTEIRHRLNLEPMTVRKSFHIANSESVVKYTHDQQKKEVPEVIYL